MNTDGICLDLDRTVWKHANGWNIADILKAYHPDRISSEIENKLGFLVPGTLLIIIACWFGSDSQSPTNQNGFIRDAKEDCVSFTFRDEMFTTSIYVKKMAVAIFNLVITMEL
jgi:hypothetical protein